jgi:hypothetical protein
MNKSNFYSGQPIFNQLVKFLPKPKINQLIVEFDADRYYKRFKTWDHLITMLYSSYQNCTSLREITSGMRACEGRLYHLGLKNFPCKSTLSDANSNRSSLIFESIFYQIYHSSKHLLPDSRMKNDVFKKLYIIDTTTISLFQNILNAAGRPPGDGRRKGGIKVHMMMKAEEDVPSLIRFTPSANNDTNFLKAIKLPKGSYVVFDKGFNSFYQFNRLTKEGVHWVTRKRNNLIVNSLKPLPVSSTEKEEGVISDEIILLGHSVKKEKVLCRRVKFYDKINKKQFEFLTNNKHIKASTVAAIYKQRWQIELLFKRLKQNMPLQYFIGDNENAIRIQIWCTLIADLLLKLATCGVKRKWSFSNLASIVRLHLMNYTNLNRFLQFPDKARIMMPMLQQKMQLNLFSSV